MEGQQTIRRFKLSGLSNPSGGYQARVNKEDSNNGMVSKGDESHTLTDPSAAANSSQFSAGTKSVTSSSGDGKFYHIDLKKFESLLDDLVSYAKHDINDLPVNIKEKLNAVKQLYANIENPSVSAQIKELIEVKFTGDSKKMVANTVEAVMKGCRYASCHGVPVGCGHLCAASLMNDPNLSGSSSCGDAVFVYKKGSLELLTYGSDKGTRAYVYVQSNEFKGYTIQMLDYLTQNNITHVRTIVTEGDKCTQMAPDFVAVESLRKHVGNSKASGVHNTNDSSAGVDTNQWWWWLVAAGVLLVVVLAIWGIMYGKKRMDKKKSVLQEAEDRVDPTGLTSSLSGANATGMSPIASPSYTEGFFKTVAQSLSPRIY